MKLFDTHAHLDDERFIDDQQAVIHRAQQAGVHYILTCGADVETSRAALAIAKTHGHIYSAAGVHPHDAKDFDARQYEAIDALLSEKKVVALGEIGLDYHYDFSPRDQQMRCMQSQLELLERHDLPVIFHIREAWGDFLSMLRADELPQRAVMHCFTGSREVAEECLSYGMMLSFTGVVTFKNAKKAMEVVKHTPMDRIMVETDCPYMAPVPHRGKRNEPAYVLDVARCIADLMKMDLGTFAETTTQNALNFFGIGE